MNELLTHPVVVAAFVSGVFLLLAAAIGAAKGESLLRYLRERKVQRLKGIMQDTCPHVEVGEPEPGEIGLRSTCHSPSGTPMWFCRVCNAQFYGADLNGLVRAWMPLDNECAKRLSSAREKAFRLRKKLSRLSNEWA